METPEITPAQVLEAVRKTDGWGGRFATRYGLYKQLVHNWADRGRVPKPWPRLIGAKVTEIITS